MKSINTRNLYKLILILLSIVTLLYIIKPSNVNANVGVDTLNSKGDEEIAIKYENEHNLSDIKLIKNATYFKNNPKHGNNDGTINSKGTCTTVAMQLLMGYHNYYSYRKIIPEYGNDGEKFLEDNYGDLLEHPSINDEVGEGQGKASIGTTDDFYLELIELNDVSQGTALGQAIGVVKDAAEKFVNKYTDLTDASITIDSGIYDEAEALSEINKDNPIILGYNPFKTDDYSFHIVVAYGYAKYNNVEGYIVHCGWGDYKNYAWIPESLIAFKIKMNVIHNHNLQYTGETVQDSYRVLRCTSCGYEELECVYQLNEDGNAITGIKYPLNENITIPDKIYNKTINVISNNAFSQNAEIKRVDFSDSLNIIGENAFYNCPNLELINISGNLQSIGKSAFKNCPNLTYVNNFSNINTIEESAFEECSNLRAVDFPSTLISIGNSAFKNCSKLNSALMKGNLKNIGNNAFEGCTSLWRVELSEMLETIGESAFKGCTSLILLDMKDNVINIKKNAFEGCASLKNFTLSTSLETIGESAFKGCKLFKNVTLPNSLKTIGSSAFMNCEGLTSISIPYRIEIIESNVFINCTSLQEITIPNNCKIIKDSAFKYCTSLNKINIPSTLQEIGVSAFEHCESIKNIELPDSITKIGENAFYRCLKLETIHLPENLQIIENNTFYGCNKIVTIHLPENLQAIKNRAFYGCSGLKNISLLFKVEEVGDEAFSRCFELERVYIKKEIGGLTSFGVNVFEFTSRDLKIIVPLNKYVEYSISNNLTTYKDIILPSNYINELTLNCKSNLNKTISLSSGYNKLYVLNIDCAKTYKILADASSDVNIKIYKDDLTKIYDDNNISYPYLNVGMYYLSVEYVDGTSSGDLNLNLTLRWNTNDTTLTIGSNDIKSALHKTTNDLYHGYFELIVTRSNSVYKFTFNAGNNIVYPEGCIKVYNGYDRTNLMTRLGGNSLAKTEANENQMYVFFNTDNTRCNITIELPYDTYNSITFEVEEIDDYQTDYLNSLASVCFDEILSNRTAQSTFKEVTISHRSKIQLDIVTSGTITDNIPIYIISKELEGGLDIGVVSYVLTTKLSECITIDHSGPVFTSILDPGTYYIGYTKNNNNVNISFALKRLVNQELNIGGTLVADPANDLGFIAGSEVTLNGGSFRGNTITEGFTRHLYLMVENVLEEPMSRLEYDWYSSNENAAKVTAYGTVLALNVNADTDVTIYAVQKDDPSRVYLKTFTIKKETETDPIFISCEMSYSYAQENGNYTLELDFSNSPFPYLAYYDYSIEDNDNIGAAIVGFGFMYSNRPGTVEITLNYRLNRRVFIYITLTITE